MLQSHRLNMRLCIIYKAYYNLALFTLLDYATPATVQTLGNNIKFILPHYSKDVLTLSCPLNSGVKMPSQLSLDLFKASLRSVTYWCHTELFLSCTEWFIILFNAVFLIIFPFLPITSRRQYCNFFTIDVRFKKLRGLRWDIFWNKSLGNDKM